MTLVKWKPNNTLRSMFTDMDRIFNQVYNYTDTYDYNNTWSPVFNISESDKEYILSADLPGVSTKNLEININDGSLTIMGEREMVRANNNDTWHYNEIQYGKFNRSFNLPETVNDDKISANFKNGVLNLIIPKIEPIKTEIKQIKIS